jgi:hypothetical protein
VATARSCMYECCFGMFSGSRSIKIAVIVDYLRYIRLRLPSKRREPVTQRRSVTPLKTWILNYTAPKTQNFHNMSSFLLNIVSTSVQCIMLLCAAGLWRSNAEFSGTYCYSCTAQGHDNIDALYKSTRYHIPHSNNNLNINHYENFISHTKRPRT